MPYSPEQSEFLGRADAAGLPNSSLDHLATFPIGSLVPLATLFKLRMIVERLFRDDDKLIHGRAYRSFRDESRAYILSVTEMAQCSPCPRFWPLGCERILDRGMCSCSRDHSPQERRCEVDVIECLLIYLGNVHRSESCKTLRLF